VEFELPSRLRRRQRRRCRSARFWWLTSRARRRRRCSRFGVGMPRNSADYPASTVMNTMLGGLFSSRINMNLREEHGYTYGASSFFRYYRGTGPFIAFAQVRTDVTAPATEQLFKELDGIHTKPLTDAELRLAKNSIIRSLPGEL
jgi:zinc protease